jgi:hypothetical protein
VTLSAHDAFAAEFDANKPVSLTGTLTKMERFNPYVWLHVQAVSWALRAPVLHPTSDTTATRTISSQIRTLWTRHSGIRRSSL